MPSLFGESIDQEMGEALRKQQGETFERLAMECRLPPAPGAEALLRELQRRGVRTALATSGSADGLVVAERASGVAWRTLFEEVVCKDDVKSSKPAPDVLHAAVAKLKLSPAQCTLIGDTRWDAESARSR